MQSLTQAMQNVLALKPMKRAKQSHHLILKTLFSASGCACSVNPGRFGGDLNGGNCYNRGTIQSQRAGTQTGSTCGVGNGDGKHGDPGAFGSGGTCKYYQDKDSGGGGGGGCYCSSGGGGSGWIFTESSFKAFQSGDASKFVLKSKHFLRDAICVGDNEEFPRQDGNGNERGHFGQGYAKITVL